MKYLLLICTEGPIEADPVDLDATRWVEEMDASGVRQLGDQLADQNAATTIRIRDGRLLTTDGPYAETKEQIVGFDIIECDDLDQAIETASKHPMATYGLIEVRPFWTP